MMSRNWGSGQIRQRKRARGAFVVARRNRNKAGGATAGPLTALANRLFGGRTGDAAGAPAAGGAAAGAGAAAPQAARRPADESEGDEFDD